MLSFWITDTCQHFVLDLIKCRTQIYNEVANLQRTRSCYGQCHWMSILGRRSDISTISRCSATTTTKWTLKRVIVSKVVTTSRINWYILHILVTFSTLRPGQMAVIFQTTFSNVFSRMKMYEVFFLGFQLTIIQHWFRYWLGAYQAIISEPMIISLLKHICVNRSASLS